jgi:hypothetical protein
MGLVVRLPSEREECGTDSGIQADRERWHTPCGWHGAGDASVLLPDMPWDWEDHCTVQCSQVGGQIRDQKVLWTEGDESLGTLK